MAVSQLESIPLNTAGLGGADDNAYKQEDLADPGTDRMQPSKLKLPKAKGKVTKQPKISKKKRKISTKSDGRFVEIAPHAHDHLYAQQKPVQVELNNFDQQLFNHDSNDHSHPQNEYLKAGEYQGEKPGAPKAGAIVKMPLKPSLKKTAEQLTPTGQASQKPKLIAKLKKSQESEEAIKAQRDELQ